MGNRTTRGQYDEICADERSVSEILGTILIFSFVIFLAVGLIVIGLHAFEGATAQTEDRLAQDSMQEMGNRLHSLTGSQIDTATEFEFPTGTGDDIKALDEGTVNVSIKTDPDYVGLVEASNQSNYTRIDLGTIEHEAADGTVTAYQGGALFEKQGDLIEIVQEPTFDYRGEVVDLSFRSVNLSQMSDSESITAKRLLEKSANQSEQIREMMRPHWNLTGYSDIMAPVTIKVTIESEYADAWQMYAENRMTETPTVNRISSNEVEIVFDKFDGGFTLTNQTFDDGVFYSGEAALTGLVNVSNATIDGLGGKVNVSSIKGSGAGSPVPQSQYMLGIYDDGFDEWLIYDTSGSGRWFNLTGSPVTPSATNGAVTSLNNDTYPIDPKETLTCVVERDPSGGPDHEQFVDYVDAPNEGCLADPLARNVPKNATVNPHFNVSFDDVRLAGPKNITTDDVVAGQDKIELEWTVENDYVSNGTTPVVLLFSEDGSSNWIPLDKTDVYLDGYGDSKPGSFQVNATGSSNVTFQVVTLDTNDKYGPVDIVKRPERGKFQIDSLSVPDSDLTAGDDLQADVEITNTAAINDTQLVELQFDDNSGSGPAPVAWKKVSMNAGTTKTVSINWTTTNAFNTSSGEVIAETYHDTASESPIEIDKGMAANATFEVAIDNINPSPIWDGDSVTVDATVENVGSQATEQDIALLADGKVVDAVLDENLSSGASTTMSFPWDSTGHGGQTVDLTVASADDTVTQPVTVQTPTPTDFDVNIDEVRVDGVPGGAVDPGNSTVTVEATVSNSGDSDAPTVWLNGFEDRVVAVDDTVQTIGLRSGDPSSTSVTLQWNVPADVNTSDTEIEIAVDGDSETRELDIESRLVVENIQTSKNTAQQATFTNIYVTDNSYDWSQQPSSFSVDYNVNPASGFDHVSFVFDGAYSYTSKDIQNSTSTTGTLSHSQSYGWWQDYTITGRIIDDGNVIEKETFNVLADGNDRNVNVSGANVVTESVDVQAYLKNIGDTTASGPVELKDPSGSGEDTAYVSGLPGGQMTMVDMTWNDPTRTGSVTVATPDDQASERVVIKRDGPDCSNVIWTTDSQGRYEISNVDQLQCIPQNGLDEDYKLVDDIDATGTKYWNNGKGFEPIGDQSRGGAEFEGDFDGQGHKIENLYIDRPNENFVGLFAVVHDFDAASYVGSGSTIENLRLEGVDIHGQQVTGGVAGATGGIIENTRVEGRVEAEYQEVGGIVGSTHNADLDNRLVVDGEVIGGIPAGAVNGVSHPWNDRNLGIGGIVGSTGYNTEVSTVYSLADVKGAFSVGGIVGWTSDYASDNRQMYWAGDDIVVTATQSEIDGYLNDLGRTSYGTATGGAIFGRGDDNQDTFQNSVYYNNQHHPYGLGEHVIEDQIDINDRTTDEMMGLGVTDRGNMSNLDYNDEGGPWVAIPGEYPRFQWELEAEGRVGVDIDESSLNSVEAGDPLDVPVTVTNSNYEEVTQTIRLFADGTPVDSTEVTVDARDLGDPPESKYLSSALTWNTKSDDDGTVQLEVRSEDAIDTETVTIQTPTTGDYTVDSISTTGPTTAGDVLTVYADINYTGSSPAPSELVTLQNFDGGVVDSKNISNDWTNLPLEWDTSEGLVSSGAITDDITVGTSDDLETEEVTIQAAGDGDFQIQNLTANDPVTEGDALNITATVENVGSKNGTQNLLLRDHGDSPVDITSVSLDPGDSTTVTLTWNTAVGDNGQDDVTVTTMDDTETKNVKIEEQPEEQLDVVVKEVRYNGSQISNGTTVEAGATLEADVAVSNATQPVTKPVWLEFAGETVAFNSGVTVNANSSHTVTLTWNVHEAMNGSDLVAKTAHDSDLFDLTIEPVRTSTMPLTTPGGEPIDVDLDKLAIG
ncbi:GLUG motif domain protein [Halorhabdus tiamatea SARL4B]|uniref:GLUG domain protein n=1 Tax=Halorhabdus tiamatea SARL4B TaxID=1033806 RepID=F7PIB5_9EURY|nr:CARDB domain-containing protein [Halorhabdus tiamatea]ERJ05220.1 GLUG motif domain protein [Halorhabdus tiamatea SARL4B]CCQ34875.1 GLUG domain protein [Halorhabdus tiamatea SARL4B]